MAAAPKAAISGMAGALKQLISLRGPLPLPTYIQQCLLHPQYGYYTTKDPLGTAGDFITSPEISQMFGELVGINLLTQYRALGSPAKARIVELGPGRGTLMSDLLRAVRSFRDFDSALSEVMLVEASPTLRKEQKKRLSSVQKSVNWLDLLREVPKDGVPTFVVAHEFLDALPIHALEKSSEGWHERLVNYDEKTEKFQFVNGTANSLTAQAIARQPRFAMLNNLSQVEVCPDAWQFARELSQLLSKNKGGALIMDYGPSHTIPSNTFRAFKQHHMVDPLETPGEADLTADVDFQALKEIFEKFPGLRVDGPVNQRDWLHRMGIGARATVLAKMQNAEGQKRISDAYNRLTDASFMGKTYKVMAVSTLSDPVVAFEPVTEQESEQTSSGSSPK